MNTERSDINSDICNEAQSQSGERDTLAGEAKALPSSRAKRAAKMKDCVFCKIANGELPVLKVYEDENTLSFMDNAKDVDGHILVIPKKHADSILDCDSQTLCDVIQTVKKVANHLTDHCGYHGVDILSANDESAGQSLLHFHIHIIPRRYNDGLGGKAEWPRFPGAKHEIAEIFQQIRMEESN